MSRTVVYKSGNQYFLRVDDNDAIECVVKQPKGWDETVFLPENPSNRKLINKARLDKALESVDEYELKEKVVVATADRAPRNTKPLEDYLEGEEREQFIKLRDKALEIKKDSLKRGMSPLEKARKMVEKYEALIRELEAKGE